MFFLLPGWTYRSWTFGDHCFSFQKQILFTMISTLSKINKTLMWEVKKIEDFCPRDIESCHLVAAGRVKLGSLNVNLTSWLRTFHFKDLIAIFLGLQTLRPYSLTKPDFFFRLRAFLQACSLQNKIGDPRFSRISDITNPSSKVVRVSEKIIVGKFSR